MFGMSNTPSYLTAAAAEIDGSEPAGVPALGGAMVGSGFRGHGQLTCPSGLWSWLFPTSPIYRSATTAAETDPAVVTEELQLDAPAHSEEGADSPRVVESKGPVTVVIRRSE